MEIDGIQKQVINECKDIKKLAFETITSFKIDIADSDIERVTKKDFQRKDKKGKVTNHTILSVRFTDFETKLKVLREKRKIKDDSKIFFNASLTSFNRFIMSSAKKIASRKNLKVFLKNGKVNVEKLDKKLMQIESEEQLTELEGYVDQLCVANPKQSSSKQQI